MSTKVSLGSLIEEVQSAVNVEPDVISAVIREFIIALKNTLAEGKDVGINNFANFTVRPGYLRTGVFLGRKSGEQEVAPGIVVTVAPALTKLLKQNPKLRAKK